MYCQNDSHTNPEEPTDSVYELSCAEAHDSEVFASGRKVVDSTWNEARLLTEALAYCAGKFVGWFSGEAAPSEIVWRAHFSNEAQSRGSGYTNIRCVLTSEGRKTIGRISVPSTNQPSDTQTGAESNSGLANPKTGADQPSSTATNRVA